jgi:glyoxylase-like metal-dependent hydrolase (beta-lactamase superfamily II)
MRLYLFQCGTIQTKKHLLVKGQETDEAFVVPIPFFLVEHPHGTLLFDTGQPLSAAGTTAGGNYVPIMTEADYVPSQLARIGYRPSDITHIVLSHLHADHAGGIEAFADAVCYLHEGEPTHGLTERHPLRWHLVRGARHDVFGDGKVQILFTPGHTAGHQSLLLDLEEWGPTLLAADSVYTDEVLAPGGFPGVCSSREDTLRTLDVIRDMHRDGVRIITGHDPQTWAGFSLAPAYYE